MPIKTVAKRHSRAPRHKHTKAYLESYWPYIPMVVIIVVGLFIGGFKPIISGNKAVLAYATNTNANGLLSSTNSQRANNGASALTINQQLSTAAQTKANDMVARNYWSHNTPDGQEPWVFIQNTGYKYSKAGENLAYGFATSNDTIIGWMNSPTHKANLLDSAFKEVGFGIANSINFNSSGNETIVVAMYGQPQVLAASTPQATTNTNVSPTPVPSPSPTPSPAPAPQPSPASPAISLASPIQSAGSNESKTSEPKSTAINSAAIITGGRTPWIIGVVSIISGTSMVVLLAKHGWGFRHVWREGENFVIHHPLLDAILVSIIMLGYVLNATKGIIR